MTSRGHMGVRAAPRLLKTLFWGPVTACMPAAMPRGFRSGECIQAPPLRFAHVGMCI